MKFFIIAFVLLFFSPFFIQVKAQENTDNLIQFSGITVTADSLNTVPYTKIIIKNKNKGTTSDIYGYFSFVAHKQDTILFNALGFKPASYVIPDTITKTGTR
jgi:hypothetical protein